MTRKNNNLNEATSVAQKKRIAVYLLAGNSITQMDALRMFGCFRLASRINDLRNEGYDIATERVVTSNGKRVASYRMRGGNQ